MNTARPGLIDCRRPAEGLTMGTLGLCVAAGLLLWLKLAALAHLVFRFFWG